MKRREPSPEEVQRASDALVPFVEEWHLDLNPEQLDLIAYVALEFFDADLTDGEVEARVTKYIEEERTGIQKMLEPQVS